MFVKPHYSPFLFVVFLFFAGCGGSERNVLDFSKPVVTLNGDQRVEITTDDTYEEAGATAMDVEDGELEVSVEGSVNSDVPGDYTLSYSATDSIGNKGTTERLVVVVLADKVAPVITIIGDDEIVEVNTTYTDAGATAVDDIDGSIDVTSVSTVDTSKVGEYTVTYTAVDSSDNKATDIREVTVKVFDRTSPVITIAGSSTVEVTQGDTYTDAGATAVDDIDGSIDVTSVSTVDTSKVGEYTVTYTAVDSSGNESTAVRNVIVKEPDTTVPVITINGDSTIWIDQGSVYGDEGATAIDDLDGSLDVITDDQVNSAIPDTYKVSYSATDLSGNKATAERTVIVIRASNFNTYDGDWFGKCRSATLLASSFEKHSLIIEGRKFVDTVTGHKADDCSDDPTTTYKIFSDLKYLGNHITGSCSGEKIDLDTNFITKDGRALSTAEVSSFPLNFGYPQFSIICLDSAVIYFGSTASGNDGSTSEKRPVDYDLRTIASYQELNTVAPVITIAGSSTVEVTQGDTYTDAGATAVDDIDGSIDVTSVSTVDTSKVGEYTVTYTAVDSSGNESTAVRNVIVKEIEVDSEVNGTWKNECEANTNEFLKTRGVLAVSSTLLISEGRIQSDVTGYNNNNCLGGAIYEGTAIASLLVGNDVAQPANFCSEGIAKAFDLTVIAAVLNGEVLSDKDLLTFITLTKFPTYNLMCIDPVGQLRTGDTSNGFNGTTQALRPILMNMTGSGYSKVESN